MDPLRSNLTTSEVTETSLAVPSEGHYRSGQERVLEQVNTIRRKKSKHGSKGSPVTLSPTSLKNDNVFLDFKYSHHLDGSAPGYESFMSNGAVKMRNQNQGTMYRTASSRSAGHQQVLRTRTKRTLSGNNILPSSPTAITPTFVPPETFFSSTGNLGYAAVSNNRWTQSFKQGKGMERKYSQHPVSRDGQLISNSNVYRNGDSRHFYNKTTRVPHSFHSNPEPKVSTATRSKSEMTGINGETGSSELSLVEAVKWLEINDDKKKLQGAAFIQHSTYTDNQAREEILKLRGIKPLLDLLSSSNSYIQEVSASALRNLVLQNVNNKMAIKSLEGVKKVFTLLKDSDNFELNKHLTGLLWNLSSADAIHADLLPNLPILIQKCLHPNAIPSEADINYNLHKEIFCNATGCLRNLSSGQPVTRKNVRNCEGLIDSLVKHMQFSYDESKWDEKSVENCVCILHNLTYNLDLEEPSLFRTLKEFKNIDEGPTGCFNNQSQKMKESCIDLSQLEKRYPQDKDRLIHSQTIQLYLLLLKSSENATVQEASCGALHNLTARRNDVSELISLIIVQRLCGVEQITPVLKSENSILQNNIMILLGNLCQAQMLHKTIASSDVFPWFLDKFSSDILNNPNLKSELDSVVTMNCTTAHKLLMADTERGKKFIKPVLIDALIMLSQETCLPKSSQAAGCFLYNLWSNIQPHLKKIGFRKETFVNERTMNAVKL